MNHNYKINDYGIRLQDFNYNFQEWHKAFMADWKKEIEENKMTWQVITQNLDAKSFKDFEIDFLNGNIVFSYETSIVDSKNNNSS